jgi:hypothetical protein
LTRRGASFSAEHEFAGRIGSADGRWPGRMRLLFIVGASLGAWAVVALVVYLLVG